MRNKRRNRSLLSIISIALIVVISLIFVVSLFACGVDSTTTLGSPSNDEDTRLSFVADFYDNGGDLWLSVEGTTFNISPNKIKEWSYDSNGSWISTWTMSSVMTIEIDNNIIQSCGSTVIFSDTTLQRYDIEIPTDVTLSESGDSSITVPSNMRLSDFWTLQYWWYNRAPSYHTAGRRIVLIQSQEGDPICMYMGDNVTWEVAANLPKTTLIHIDGKALYIHRANFAIIDTSVFGG